MAIKRILIAFFILFIILLSAALIIPYVFKDKILVAVKTGINKNINAKVDFQELDITLIRSFPNLGLRLNDLTVAGVDSFATDTLADIRQLDLNVDLMSVIKGETYQIKSIGLENPIIKARVLKSGKANWDIVKEDTTSGPADTLETSFKAALQKYSLENAKVIYDDASLGFYMELDSLNHSGKGDFTQDIFTLETASDIKKMTVKYGGIPYLNKVNFKADLPLEIDTKQMKFTFGENKINLNQLVLAFSGYLAMPNDSDMVLDFKFDARESDLKNFLSLIPAIYATSFKDMQASGKFAFNGTAKGTYNDKSLPAFDVNLSIVNGKIKYPSLPSGINNIQVKARISNPDGVIDHTVVDIPSFHLEFGNNPLDGRLLVKTPESNPFLDVVLKGKLDLKQLTAIFPMKDMTLSGVLNADLKASGNKSAADKGQYTAFKASGHVSASQFNYSGTAVSKSVHISSAKMTFNPTNITLNNLSAKVGKSDFEAKGTIDNYLAYVFEKNEKLKGSFDVSSSLVDINELMGPSSKDQAAGKDTAKLTVIEVPANIDFKLGVKAGRVVYDNYDIKNARGTLAINNQTVYFRDMGLEMLDGKVNMNGMYATADVKKPKVDIDFNIDKMNIQKAFGAFNTVKLLAPVAKYTQGQFSANLKFDSDLDQHMVPVYSSINASGLTNIIKAIVQGFEPLNKLSAALNSDKLQTLELNNVLTKFTIEEGKLKVAPFVIRKDNFTMNVQGSNGLDLSLNYNLGMDVPRAYLGAKANAAGDALLAKFNSKAGTSASLGETVKVNAMIGGTVLKPTVKLSLEESKTAAKAAVNQLVAEKRTELESKAKQEVSEFKEKSVAEVKQKADTLKKQATTKATEEVKSRLNNLFKKKAPAESTAE
mgnify:CR=1 FL=1